MAVAGSTGRAAAAGAAPQPDTDSGAPADAGAAFPSSAVEPTLCAAVGPRVLCPACVRRASAGAGLPVPPGAAAHVWMHACGPGIAPAVRVCPGVACTRIGVQPGRIAPARTAGATDVAADVTESRCAAGVACARRCCMWQG